MQNVARFLVFALVLAACAPAGPSPSAGPSTPPGASASPGTDPTPSTPASGPIPILIDTDFGMDDIVAIAVLLRDPGVDVRAITLAGTGEVRCGSGMRNLQLLLAAFGASGIRIGCGREMTGPNGREFPSEWRDGADAFYGLELPPLGVVEGPVDAPRLIARTIVESPMPLTIVPIGPWTNLADAFATDPTLVAKVAGIHAMAGTVDAPGNVEVDGMTPADGVEWNVAADPDAFAAVMALDVPVTLIPLDATNDLPVPADIVARLEADHAAAGADIAFEIYLRNEFLSTPGNFWWDTLAAVSLTAPDLATWEDAAVAVTPSGTQAGRISRAAGGRSIRFAVAADTELATEAVLAGLRRGDPRPEPFTISGTLSVRWDGSTCRIEGPPPTSAGLVFTRLANGSAAPVGMFGAVVTAPRAWADAVAFIEAADFADPDLVIPDWIAPLEGGGGFAAAGETVTGLGTLSAGEVGVLCAVGEWPDFTLTDGGSFVVE